MILEDKAKQETAESGMEAISHANRIVGYKMGYKQAIDDLMETINQVRKNKGRLTDEHWWSFEEIKEYAEELKK